jgi:hypothetical protein
MRVVDQAEQGPDRNRRHRREQWLKPTDSHQRQHPLKDRPKTDQHHEQFEKICQTTVINELFDGPKANCADNANNQNPDQN